MMQHEPNGTFLKSFDMKVAAKVIQLISSGIYRTPANAVKELISNSFDADATRVDIILRADYKKQKVAELVMEDNGSGLTSGDFEFSMTHIGSSLKVLGEATTSRGRPVIGRIGIGMLSVGQATNKFSFVSTTEDGKGIRAEIDLSPYYDQLLMVESLDELNIGNVKLFELDNPSKKTMTKIALRELKNPFSRLLTWKLGRGKNFDFDENPSYEEFVRWIDTQEIKRLDELSPFNKFMFELGLLAPVRYLPEGPIRRVKSKVLDKIKKRLEDYDFHVYVNGVEIFKPILFPHKSDSSALTEEESCKIYEKEFDVEVDDRKISAKCYYYHQAVRILPYELRGVLLRVKNVGIGSYENAFSKIASESPVVLHQLTGELYVDEGLDDALNVDRNSFFESDEAYQRLWLEVLAWVNPDHLPAGVREYISPAEFPVSYDIRRRLESRRKARRRLKANSEKTRREESLKKNLKEILSLSHYPCLRAPELEILTIPKSRLNATLRTVKDRTSVTVTLDRKYPQTIQDLLILFLVAHRVALETSRITVPDFEDTFTKILKRLRFS